MTRYSYIEQPIDLSSPAWQDSKFYTIRDKFQPTCYWLIALSPAGVRCRLAFIRSGAIAELILEVLTKAQQRAQNSPPNNKPKKTYWELNGVQYELPPITPD